MTEGIKRQMWHVPMDRGCVSAPGSRKHPRSRSEKSEPQNGWYYFPREVHVTAPRSPEVDADIMGPGRSFPIPEDRRIHAEQLVPSEQDIAAGNRSGRDGSGKCALPSKEPCNQYRNQLGNRQKHRLEYATGSPEAESDKLPFEKLAVATGYGGESCHAATPIFRAKLRNSLNPHSGLSPMTEAARATSPSRDTSSQKLSTRTSACVL